MSSKPIPIVDLFAGPGGLGEGFSSLSDGKAFRIVVSAEMDQSSWQTLRLRAFYRILKSTNSVGLEDYYRFCNGDALQPWTAETEEAWNAAGNEARQITLGTQAGNEELDSVLVNHLDVSKPWVLIGGPPCQAYSVVGRSRNRGNSDYKPEEDHRHFLYREYLRIIQRYRPSIFIMENVRGILTAKVADRQIFHEILVDLANPDAALGVESGLPGYTIHSLVADATFTQGMNPEDIDSSQFVICSEQYGIPQTRHRVILLGIRDDVRAKVGLLDLAQAPTVKHLIGTLPKLRSTLSKQADSDSNWNIEVKRHFQHLHAAAVAAGKKELADQLLVAREGIGAPLDRGGLRYTKVNGDGSTGIATLDSWLLDPKLSKWLNHEARGHMTSDLRRYAYAAAFAKAAGASPFGHEQFDLPDLSPAHKNWESGKFPDRFRVQVAERPSTTITSHISKDGHCFIHYDPVQCRSLTVREAARLQTFPDNYFFQGNRTQQFHQVGNAVPPLLASKIAHLVAHLLTEKPVESVLHEAADQVELAAT
ncbi:Modification methylase HaeIII [Andreprevotia sp. IGB-42]|uniref:DNA cytosine methyltransferase n=1 Tax=Andreprevotia sp. IGB-42 TaxID=2497473 RepID=UPI00135BA375|nr:DNA (cytosine-5-)-methyltransferase [Andreprevotia sp. IGB-42]KAF0811949.1 Modification methylase HaeIII [Andreprevotia sp. IGB-42]